MVCRSLCPYRVPSSLLAVKLKFIEQSALIALDVMEKVLMDFSLLILLFTCEWFVTGGKHWFCVGE